MKYLAVAIAGFVLGGWSVPLGYAVGLGPAATFASAAVGGLVGCWLFLFAGDSIQAFFSRRKNASEAHPTSDDAADTAESPKSVGKVSTFVNRYGVRGLGVVGPLFPGVTVSVLGGLALGLDRRQLGKWLSIGIIGMYGLYVVGLWFLLSLF